METKLGLPVGWCTEPNICGEYVMESFKEFLNPKSFNRLSLLVVILWDAIGVILLGIFADIETNEQRYFRCMTEGEKKDYNQGLCFDDYQTKYTRRFPLYGFILLDFLLVTIVCLIYSQFVKTRVQDLESDDVEMQRSQSIHRLYFSYCIQLAARLFLGILFPILQWGVLYPVNFPSKYSCDLSLSVQQVNFINITSTRRNITESLYDCHNPQASKKTFCSIFLFVVNVVFTILILVELLYILHEGKKDGEFKKDLNFFSIHLLNRDNTVEAYVNEMKECIKQDIREYKPLFPNIPGEETKVLKFDEIYTNLIIYPGRAEYEFDKKRHEIIEGYLKSQEKHKSINKIEGIFMPNEYNPNEVRLNIMIIGRPGIGKTLLCQKILRDWASDKIFSDETGAEKRFEFVYLFRFRNFSSDKLENLNLQQLLARCQFGSGSLPDEVFEFMLNNPEKVLVIFDGLDEFAHKSKIANEEQFGNNFEEKMPFSALYAKLALGKLLKGATVVTTSRPTALLCVAKIKFDRTVEILGFNFNQIEEYIGKFFFQNEIAKQKVWNHIRTNANLLSLCYIPVNCHIVCFSFQERLLDVEREEYYLPLTLTEIFEDALMLILYKHNPEYRIIKDSEQEKLLSTGKFTPKIDASLKFLGELAYKGIESNRLIFELNEVEGHEECGLLHRLQDQKLKARRKAQFCFVHLTMQEFLAARYIVATKKDHREGLQTWVSKNIGEGKWQIVIQFVAGLLHGEDQSKIKIFTDILPTARLDIKGSTVWPQDKDKTSVLMLFKCIFEMSRSLNKQWKNLVKVDHVETVDFSFFRISDADMAAIVYVLQEVESIHSLDLHDNYIGLPGCLEICKLLTMTKPIGHDGLQQNREYELTALNICNNAIGDDGLKHLSDALSKVECKLTTLDIRHNKIGDDGLKHLSNALSKVECKLTTLDIGYNEIGDDGLKHLSDALSKVECKLTTLDIRHNKIGDDGLKHLSNALSKVECKLTTLDIGFNEIGDDGLKHLSDALSKVECKLTTLDICYNEIGDDGLKHLSNALSKVECKLTTLDIGYNEIGGDGLKHLSDALSKVECKLTTLDIGYNEIGDDGLKHLSNALSKDECKLTTLNICGNKIHVGADGLKHLSDALSKDECKLTTLYISDKEIGDDGLKHLSDALSKDECKLTTLYIGSNKIGDDGLKHLSDALSKDECKLTTLYISSNKIGDDGLKHLSDALSKDECKLTTLYIDSNKIGDDGLKHLSNALSKVECKLTTLDIGFNEIGDDGLKHLSDALSKDECKLTTLDISHNKISDVGLEYLQSNVLLKPGCKLQKFTTKPQRICDLPIHLCPKLFQ